MEIKKNPDDAVLTKEDYETYDEKDPYLQNY